MDNRITRQRCSFSADKRDEVQVPREVLEETTGKARVPFTDEHRRRLATKTKT